MDFKSQIAKDMAVFHNPNEMAETVDFYYNGSCYTVPVVMDHTEARERTNTGDHAEGIFQVDCVLYMALADIGFVPRKGATIEIGTENTGYTEYEIMKSNCEDDEIILEMAVFTE